ncbi:DUF5106 domain-containing protein [Porphyromonadaceae bacterium W3.11]|nr:DUF5106 domain-containing protein [Porphyromonadaceae bacterium W3.11]
MNFVYIMRKSGKHLCMLTALLLLVACSGKRGDSHEQLVKPEFPVPPEMITEPEARANYIVDQVWKDIDLLDSANYPSAQEMERFLVDYFAIGDIASDEKFEASLNTLFTIATPAMDSIVLAFNDSYLSHPNSPIYNLEQYYQVLAVADQESLLDPAAKLRYEEGYKLFLKNRVGTRAEDFTYVTPDGKSHTLHSTAHEGDLLVVFYNPDCHTCKEVLKYLSQSERVLEAVKSKKLSVLCIYPDGDESLWRENLDEIPDYATAGMDQNKMIVEKSLYDLKASPTLYLLDSEKNVILKDLFPDQLEDYLNTETV